MTASEPFSFSPSAEGTLPPGTVLEDRYLSAQELGRGGAGVVYAGLDTHTGQPVALKISSSDDQESQARLRREARIGQLLGDALPGVVRCLAWGTLPAFGLYMVMDLIEEARPLDLCVGARAARLRAVLQAARTLAQVHEQGVIHRDVKPGNFLVAGGEAPGRLLLTDFGLAKRLDEREPASEAFLTVTGSALGTPAFMPPEQFADTSQVDARADVYALGVMLYQALTEHVPFSGNALRIMGTQFEAKSRGARLRPSIYDPELLPALDALCDHATRLEVEQRLPSAAEFAQRLAPLIAESGPARPSSGGPSYQQPTTPLSGAAWVSPLREAKSQRATRPDPEQVPVHLAGGQRLALVQRRLDDRRRLALLEGDRLPVLLLEGDGSSCGEQRLAVERRVLRIVQHPNVTRFLGVSAEEPPALVLEPSPPPPRELGLPVALAAGLDLLTALERLHEEGLTLPGLDRPQVGIALCPPAARLPQPERLAERFARGEARLVLADLSHARSFASLRDHFAGRRHVLLPPVQLESLLAPPELVVALAEGQEVTTPPALVDVYAAGHLLQAWATGLAPFARARGRALLPLKRAELASAPPLERARLDELLPGLAALVGELLAADPAQRPSAGEARARLAELSRARPVEARGVGGQLLRPQL